MTNKLAIDVGNVIFEGPYFKLVTDIKKSLEILSDKYELFILSSCGLETENKCREELFKNGFNEIINENNWIFVRNKNSKINKMKQLNIDYLIDDNEDTIKNCNKYRKRSGILYTSWNEILEKLNI